MLLLLSLLLPPPPAEATSRAQTAQQRRQMKMTTRRTPRHHCRNRAAGASPQPMLRRRWRWHCCRHHWVRQWHGVWLQHGLRTTPLRLSRETCQWHHRVECCTRRPGQGMRSLSPRSRQSTQRSGPRTRVGSAARPTASRRRSSSGKRWTPFVTVGSGQSHNERSASAPQQQQVDVRKQAPTIGKTWQKGRCRGLQREVV